MPRIPALERLEQEGLEFKGSLSFLQRETLPPKQNTSKALPCEKSKLWLHWGPGGWEETKGLLEISDFLISAHILRCVHFVKIHPAEHTGLERCQVSQHVGAQRRKKTHVIPTE